MNLEMIIQHIKVLYLYILRLLNVDVSHEYMDLEKLKIEAYRGDPEAQYQFGFKTIRYRPYLDKYNSEKIIIDGSIAIHEREAVEWIKKAANQGHENARYTLGEIYEKGELTIAADEREAIGWYEKAGYQGHPKAQIKLIEMYREGKGTRKDNEQAEEWEERAENNTRTGYRTKRENSIDKSIELYEMVIKTPKFNSKDKEIIANHKNLEEAYIDKADELRIKIDRRLSRGSTTEKQEALEESYRSKAETVRKEREVKEKEIRKAEEIKERGMSEEEKQRYKEEKELKEKLDRYPEKIEMVIDRREEEEKKQQLSNVRKLIKPI